MGRKSKWLHNLYHLGDPLDGRKSKWLHNTSEMRKTVLNKTFGPMEKGLFGQTMPSIENSNATPP